MYCCILLNYYIRMADIQLQQNLTMYVQMYACAFVAVYLEILLFASQL